MFLFKYNYKLIEEVSPKFVVYCKKNTSYNNLNIKFESVKTNKLYIGKINLRIAYIMNIFISLLCFSGKKNIKYLNCL